MKLQRRHFVSLGGLALGAAALPFLFRAKRNAHATGLVPDPDGILDLPPSFSYRVLQRVGEPMTDGYRVPGLPDGMACFAAPQGKLVLLRNHEVTRSFGHGAYKSEHAPVEAFDSDGVRRRHSTGRGHPVPRCRVEQSRAHRHPQDLRRWTDSLGLARLRGKRRRRPRLRLLVPARSRARSPSRTNRRVRALHPRSGRFRCGDERRVPDRRSGRRLLLPLAARFSRQALLREAPGPRRHRTASPRHLAWPLARTKARRRMAGCPGARPEEGQRAAPGVRARSGDLSSWRRGFLRERECVLRHDGRRRERARTSVSTRSRSARYPRAIGRSPRSKISSTVPTTSLSRPSAT